MIAMPSAVTVLLQGSIMHALVRRHTKTTMESKPAESGKSVTKSRPTISQGREGVGSGCSKPYKGRGGLT